MVVIAIVASLMMMAAPSYRSVTSSNRIAAEIDGLLGDLQFARVEAIKQGQPVVVCVSADGAQCANSTNWQSGWIVFADLNGNGAPDAGETVLRVQRPFVGTDTFQASNNVTAVTFNREGLAIGIANGTLITLHESTHMSTFTRCLSVSMVGLMEVQTYGGACT